jgi:ribosome maturation factor RimP
VTTLSGEEFKGELTEVGTEEFVIQPEKKKKIIQEPQAFKYTNVKEAKVIISFK